MASTSQSPRLRTSQDTTTHLTDIQSGAGRSHTVTGPPPGCRRPRKFLPKPRRSRQYAPYLAACENPGAPSTKPPSVSAGRHSHNKPRKRSPQIINSKLETFWNPTKNSLDTLPQPRPLAAISHRSQGVVWATQRQKVRNSKGFLTFAFDRFPGVLRRSPRVRDFGARVPI